MLNIFRSTRGALVDRVTQRWVQATGRRVDLEADRWLRGPIGHWQGIGFDYFEGLAGEGTLSVSLDGDGLLSDLSSLEAPEFHVEQVRSEVKDFYEHTATYSLDAWSEWNPLFGPFGGVLAWLFSRRLEQLNVPLRGLDASHGMESKILRITNADGEVSAAWVRRLVRTKRVLYVGNYSIVRVPNHPAPCVKVVFPLPNGNAMVIMKVKSHEDGSLSVISRGERFGDPGFYFTVHSDDGTVHSRYVRTMQEEIRVFADEEGTARADHTLWIYGVNFLNLHYRMVRKRAQKQAARQILDQAGIQ